MIKGEMKKVMIKGKMERFNSQASWVVSSHFVMPCGVLLRTIRDLSDIGDRCVCVCEDKKSPPAARRWLVFKCSSCWGVVFPG